MKCIFSRFQRQQLGAQLAQALVELYDILIVAILSEQGNIP
jgi:hypothetical protein